MAAVPVVLTLVLASAGCPGAPVTHYYLLGAQTAPETATARATRGIAVGIRPFEVDTPYDQDRIVYRLGRAGVEVGFYDYHRWAAPVGSMLQAIVASRLADAPGVGSIEPAVAGRRYDAWLTGRVLDLHEIDHPGGQDVHVRLELALELAEGSRLWSATVERKRTLDARKVGPVVEAMNAVVTEAIDVLRPQLVRALEALDHRKVDGS